MSDLLTELESIEAHRERMDAIAGDPTPRLAEQTAAIKAAILAVGRDSGGDIDPNVVRDRLRGMTLHHKRIGAAWSSLRAEGLIEHAGVTESDDKAGRNAGRLIRTYRLTEAGWSA